MQYADYILAAVLIYYQREADPKGRFLAFYRVALSWRKAPPEFRFAPSTLRNFVPSGSAHEAATGHALAEPSANYTANFKAVFSRTITVPQFIARKVVGRYGFMAKNAEKGDRTTTF